MATVQLVPMTTINGMTTTQLIITQVSPDRPKLILPKQEPQSPHMETKQPSKRRIHFSKKALTHPRPQSVTRRNARERNRVKQVNQGFVTLANHIPPHLKGKKMSKLGALQAALTYIQDLQDLLQQSDSSSSSVASPTSSRSESVSPVSSPQSPPAATFSHPAASYTPTTCYQSAPYQQMSPNYQQTSQFQPYQPVYQPYAEQYGNNQYTNYGSDTCPSPTSSYTSDNGYQGQITPEYESEILEFASWFQ